jgi:hypothetical protein
MMPWTTPEATFIRMSAEIGGYQPDFDDDEQAPPFLSTDPPPDATLEHDPHR